MSSILYTIPGLRLLSKLTALYADSYSLPRLSQPIRARYIGAMSVINYRCRNKEVGTRIISNVIKLAAEFSPQARLIFFCPSSPSLSLIVMAYYAVRTSNCHSFGFICLQF